MRRTLADMAAVSVGALHLVVALTALEDRIDVGIASDADVLVHRFLVNVAKYVVSVQATAVVHAAIEVLGGNGAIEDFSVLPRLYRDALVYESWEGSHNVLVAQVLNDLRRLPVLDAVGTWLKGVVATVDDAALAGSLATGMDQILDAAQHCADDPVAGAWHFRDVVDRLGIVAESALLAGAGQPALAHHLLAGPTVPGVDPDGDAGMAGRVEDVLDAMG